MSNSPLSSWGKMGMVTVPLVQAVLLYIKESTMLRLLVQTLKVYESCTLNDIPIFSFRSLSEVMLSKCSSFTFLCKVA